MNRSGPICTATRTFDAALPITSAVEAAVKPSIAEQSARTKKSPRNPMSQYVMRKIKKQCAIAIGTSTRSLETKYGMAEYVPVAYSRRNMGRSMGNVRSIGCERPNCAI